VMSQAVRVEALRAACVTAQKVLEAMTPGTRAKALARGTVRMNNRTAVVDRARRPLRRVSLEAFEMQSCSTEALCSS